MLQMTEAFDHEIIISVSDNIFHLFKHDSETNWIELLRMKLLEEITIWRIITLARSEAMSLD